MKRKLLVLFIIGLFVVSLCGCESMGDKAKTGTVVGGLAGATAGGIIGYQSGHPLIGAGIGAAVGAIGGALIGNMMDQKDKAALAVNPNHIPLTKIAELSAQGTPDSVIIAEIERTHSVYDLNSEIIDYLKKNKASDKLIDYMLSIKKTTK